jgi:hypothetical protein
MDRFRFRRRSVSRRGVFHRTSLPCRSHFSSLQLHPSSPVLTLCLRCLTHQWRVWLNQTDQVLVATRSQRNRALIWDLISLFISAGTRHTCSIPVVSCSLRCSSSSLVLGRPPRRCSNESWLYPVLWHLAPLYLALRYPTLHCPSLLCAALLRPSLLHQALFSPALLCLTPVFMTTLRKRWI